LALPPEPGPSLFREAGIASLLDHRIVDLTEYEAVRDAVLAVDPEIVIHMAAQPLVLQSYREPVRTMSVNVLGTAHLLEALRAAPSLRSALVVTSDKVYEDDHGSTAHGEGDRLGGHDPYSASKAMVELLVASFAKGFYDERDLRLAT